ATWPTRREGRRPGLEGLRPVAILWKAMATYRELLQQVREEIDEVSSVEAHGLSGADEPPLFLDVRNQDEWDEGFIPGAIHIPRGNLESRVEGLLPERDRELVVYCDTGRRRSGHARHRRRRRRRRLEPAASDRPLDRAARRAEGALREADDRGPESRRDGRPLRGAAHVRQRRAHPRRRLGRDRRRRRQLPHALPRERRLRLARRAGRARLDLPLRRPGHRLQAARRAVLPLPLPAAAAAGARAA